MTALAASSLAQTTAPVTCAFSRSTIFTATCAPPGGIVITDPEDKTKKITVAAGGAEHMATLVSQLREGHRNTIFVAAGDLISASPFLSRLSWNIADKNGLADQVSGRDEDRVAVSIAKLADQRRHVFGATGGDCDLLGLVFGVGDDDSAREGAQVAVKIVDRENAKVDAARRSGPRPVCRGRVRRA